MKSVTLAARNFKCPITGEFIKDPVVAPNGVTYERSAIEALLEPKKTIPQYSGSYPTKKSLVPNLAFKSLIETPEVAQQLKESKSEIIIKEDDMPKCPITQDEVFKHAVLADDGYTYEKEELEKHGVTSPMTRAPFVQPLRPNKFVTALTEEYTMQNKVELEKENEEVEKVVAKQSHLAPANDREYLLDYNRLSDTHVHYMLSLLNPPRPMIMNHGSLLHFNLFNDNHLIIGTSYTFVCYSVLFSPSGRALVMVPEFEIRCFEERIIPLACISYEQRMQQREAGVVVGF